MKRAVYAILITILLILTYLACSGYPHTTVTTAMQTPLVSSVQPMKEETTMNELRVMTYNIRHGLGSDNILALDRIAQVIRSARVDVVGLNEVDVNLIRSGLLDQSQMLEQMVSLKSTFVPSIQWILGQYGNALLSSYPVTEVKRVELPRFQEREPRSLGIFTLRFAGRDVHVLVTHLGLNPVEREEQFRVLTEQILALQGPIMVLGDFNVTETSPVVQKFIQKTGLIVHSHLPTFPSESPNLKLDYILTSEEWEMVEEVEVIASLASDHLPLVGRFRLKPQTP